MSIPFTRAGNLIVVNGKIGDVTGSFILDTGAPYLVLNKTYFSGAQQTSLVASGVTNKVAVGKMKIDTLKVPGFNWQNLKADVVDLSAVENSKKIKILGLLGVSLFKNTILTIDYANAQLIITSEKSKNEMEFGSIVFKEKLTVYDNRLIGKVQIGGKKLRAVFDTGAEISVLHNDQKEKVWEQVEIKGRYMMSGVGGERTEVLSAVTKKLRFGDMEIENTRTIVSNLDGLSEAYGFDVDYVIGYTIMSGYVITFNFVDNVVMMANHAN
ncbi:MAG: retropepsin-like domain-containing protein [Bacteroidia bacterium]